MGPGEGGVFGSETAGVLGGARVDFWTLSVVKSLSPFVLKARMLKL